MPASQPTLIAVDIGNSSLRVGEFNVTTTSSRMVPERVKEWRSEDNSFERLYSWLPAAPVNWAVSSVNRPLEQNLAKWHQIHRPNDEYHLLSHTDVSLKIDLDQPDRIGMDRLAAAVAADAIRHKDRAIIVVDAGSAITVDIVSADSVFLGGAILPGLAMAAEALHFRTDQLPDIQQERPILRFREQGSPPDTKSATPLGAYNSPLSPIGKSTDDAIRSGLVWGTVGALRFLIQQMEKNFDKSPDVVFAGGDATLLAPLVQLKPVSYPNLVLKGIALIQYQRKPITES